MGQGNDRGTQYRSGVYYADEEQKALIEASKAAYQKALGQAITTEVAAASDYDQCFYYGEDYHRAPPPHPGAHPEPTLGPARRPRASAPRAPPHRAARLSRHVRAPRAEQYLAKPGARPYCSAQPQGVDLAPFESWCPPGLESYAPKLPEAFWDAHKPRKGCSVVNAPNEPVVM